MSQPTTAVSLRINEEDLELLDAFVGTKGTRNRSDVVRLAIQAFLHNRPLLAEMETIQIPLGRADQAHLGMLYELQGTTPEIAAQEGLKLYIKQSTELLQTQQSTLQSLVDSARESTMRRSEYQE